MKKQTTLIFATNNLHKIEEVSKILNNQFDIKTLAEIGCDEDIPETQPTIEGNALQKARYIFEKYKVNCFSEDTGLEVNTLNGEPGVLSARYAGEHGNAEKNMKLLLKNLNSKTDRSAHFKTVIALILDGQEYLFEGICEGSIRLEKSGGGGFGYDPIFEPKGYDRTFGELPSETKNTISHRAKATNLLRDFLLKL
jgi:XTP/dITP diphosphohydrolase